METKVVLVTGALAGIGQATSLQFAGSETHVVVSGRDDSRGKSLVAKIKAAGGNATFIKADVTSEQDVAHLHEVIISEFGRLDIAVNNAGTEGVPGSVTEQTAKSYNATFDTNVLGVILSLRHQIQIMQKQGYGSIVNVSSSLGHKGAAGASVYAASKHAVEGLTKSAALEVAAYGIRVNAVAPGPVDTGMLSRWTGTEEVKQGMVKATVPLQRAGKPEEVAQAIYFLASEGASFITGQILGVDGGQSAS
ncbi:SDR family NAD(P)-dependent oxidoreductase [Pseudomonas gozinkensis]|uniref:SDR family NAD(P)-dependent oxidoreductase n=1 Tax=Pseudomonas gozinkensis TaxID=2774461 RepID=UPI0017885F32|nr:glucose 1-dehydrogenase [Pseudomonas gozinkensis]